MTTFWAHSDRNGLPESDPAADWQPLREHLASVSEIAGRLASLAVPGNAIFEELARTAGLLHDLGKYSDCFQRRIRGSRESCPHAIHGAALAYLRFHAPQVGFAIAGHHAGIPDSGPFGENAKANTSAANDLIERASHDCPQIAALFSRAPFNLPGDRERFDLQTRMLFSCLVDADRLDTAGREYVQAPLDAAHRLGLLLAHVERLGRNSGAPAVSTARQQVFQDCLNAASWGERLLSLSVPTGGGKTLASMAFALKRAALRPEQYRRVIVVIPFLSIIEQNAQVYADIFGRDAVLEHHSGNFERLDRKFNKSAGTDAFTPAVDKTEDPNDPSYSIETENWDTPFIVTTSVRFFESLFSNRPSDLRRVHNIARSIIILDEVQTLPRNLLGPLLGMIRELAQDWGCTFVFSTATQPGFESPNARPDFSDLRWPEGTLREIVTQPRELYATLKRTSIEWRTASAVEWPQVAEWLTEHAQALCIVNTRKHAGVLYDELDKLAAHPPGSLFHLSTLMCAAHRLDVITRIKQRLADRLPCIVVSTQLIEAGVDVDFPIAFRALGPLDSIIQSAGRVDREGKLTAELGRPAGRLIVFMPQDHKTPPNAYKEATQVTCVLAHSRDIQCDDVDVMRTFFERYYGEGADLGRAFIEMRRDRKFADLAQKFEMISSRSQDVFVPYMEGKAHIDSLARTRALSTELRRKLNRFTVGIHAWEFEEYRIGALYRPVPVIRDREALPCWAASAGAYHQTKGLIPLQSAESLIIEDERPVGPPVPPR